MEPPTEITFYKRLIKRNVEHTKRARGPYYESHHKAYATNNWGLACDSAIIRASQ